MKKILISIFTLILSAAAAAQTLNVHTGNVTYMFPAAQTGDMTYTDGSAVSIMGKTFNISDISSMKVDDSSVSNNLVSIVFSNSGDATVTVAGNVAQYVSPTISGNHVSISQLNTAAVDGDEITYQLSGTTSDGSLTLSGSYKCTVSLAGVTLTNPSGAAINISNSKRIQISAKSETVNTLADGANGSQKACIYSKGQLQLQGKGTLNVEGNTKHAIKSASYVSIKNLTLNITSAVSDGISCEEYMQMKSGTVNISGVGDDGIQCDFGDATALTGETTDHEDEDSGNIYIEGGTLTVSASATAAKGIKCAGDMNISGGSVTVTTTGSGTWDTDDLETKAASGLSADGNMNISGGTLVLTARGSGGKGMKCDGLLTVTGGDITANTYGGLYYNNGTTENTNYTSDTDRIDSSYYSSPKGIKAGLKTLKNNSYKYTGGIVISGGTINVTTSGHNAEGIESKNTLNISNGYIYVKAYDDGINSAQDMEISGGYVMSVATANDGIDANGNMTISGGNIVAVSANEPEVGLDAAEGKTLSITGGNIVAVGGLERGASVSNGTAYQASSYSKGSWYGLYNSSNSLAFAFKMPSNNNMGTPMVVYTTGTTSIKSGVSGSGTSFWSGNGYSACSGGSSVSLSTYNGGGSGPGGGGRPGGGGGWW